jgi:hypothetical protein
MPKGKLIELWGLGHILGGWRKACFRLQPLSGLIGGERMLKISGAVLSAALLVSIFAVSPANAAMSSVLSLRVSDTNGTSVTINDNKSGDTSSKNGIISADPTTYGNFVPVWWFSFPTSENDATIIAEGSPAGPQGSLTLSDIDIKTGTAGTLKIELTNTYQNSPVGSAYLTEGLTVNTLTGTGNSVTLQGFESNTNLAFDESGIAGTPITLNSANVAGITGTSAVGTFTSPFSITEVATLTFGDAAGGEIDLNFTGTLGASPVPEPASMMLFGTILAGVGFVMRKRLQTGNLV